MAALSEIEKLKARIAQLEQALAEEQEEHEWDLKTSSESSQKTIRRLEEENERLRKSPSPAGPTAKGSDVEMLTQRALLAERRVAELREELKRSRSLATQSTPREDPLLRQRAESAEAERDQLRREKRNLERSLEERKTALEKAKKEIGEVRKLHQEIAGLKKDLSSRSKDVGQQQREADASRAGLEGELARARSELKEKDGEIDSLRKQLESRSTDLDRELEDARQRIRQLVSDAERTASAGAADFEARGKAFEQRNTELQNEVNRLNQELAKVELASGQMVEHRVREVERLKTDMREAQEREAASQAQLDSVKREIARLKDELKTTGSERDRLATQIRSLQESENTVVNKDMLRMMAKPDPFEEKTIPSTSPRGSRPTPPPTEGPERTGESTQPYLIEQDSEVASNGEASATSDVGEPVIASSEPAADVESVQDIEPDEMALPELEPEIEAPMSIDPFEQPAADALPDFPEAPLPREITEEVDRKSAREKPEHEVHAARGTAVVKPLDARRPRQGGSSVGLVVLIVVIVLLGAGVVIGALHFFPIWFGVGDVEGVTPPEIPDAGALPIAEAAIASEPAAASVDAGLEDGGEGTGSPADGMLEAVADEEASAPPEPDEELLKAQTQVRRLLAQRKHRQAFNLAQTWVERRPEDPMMHFYLGRALFGLKRVKPATEAMEKVIELDPQFEDAYMDLGGLYLRQNQRERACEALQKFLQLSPKHRLAPSIRKTLRKQRCP